MCACVSIAARFKPKPAPIVQLSLSDCTEISSWRLGAGCETSSIPPSIMYLGVDSHNSRETHCYMCKVFLHQWQLMR